MGYFIYLISMKKFVSLSVLLLLHSNTNAVLIKDDPIIQGPTDLAQGDAIDDMEAYERAADDEMFEKMGRFAQADAIPAVSEAYDEHAMDDPEFDKEKHEAMDTTPSPEGIMDKEPEATFSLA